MSIKYLFERSLSSGFVASADWHRNRSKSKLLMVQTVEVFGDRGETDVGISGYSYATPGAGYQWIDAVRYTSGTYSYSIQGYLDWRLNPRWMWMVSIVTPGSGYAPGDVLNVSGGTFTNNATVMVQTVGAGGIVTQIGVVSVGVYTVIPTGTLNTTYSGSGTGCQISATWLQWVTMLGSVEASTGIVVNSQINPNPPYNSASGTTLAGSNYAINIRAMRQHSGDGVLAFNMKVKITASAVGFLRGTLCQYAAMDPTLGAGSKDSNVYLITPASYSYYVLSPEESMEFTPTSTPDGGPPALVSFAVFWPNRQPSDFPWY